MRSERRASESDQAFTTRTARTQTLTLLLHDLEFDELHKASLIRNSLEHFDEYLDKLNGLIDGKAIGADFIAYNLAVSDRDAMQKLMQKTLYPARLYEATTHVFHNLDQTVDLGRLASQAAAISARLLEQGVLGGLDQRGGILFPVRRV